MKIGELMTKWNYRPIRNCPGRFVLCRNQTEGMGDIDNLVATHPDGKSYRTPRTQDAVVVIKLEDGGLISYCKPGGRYVHTLNTPEGFLRKLEQLEIAHKPPQP